MDQIVRGKDPASPDIADVLGLDRAGGSRKRRRPLLWLAVLAFLAVAAGVYWLWSPSTDAAPVFIAAPAERGDITVEVTATGTLQPVIQVDISSELSGVIRSVPVVENQRVAKGDVLAELDTTRLAAQVERAQASVTAAEAKVSETRTTLKETELTLNRTRSLSDRGMVADQALETAQAARDRADSAVATAEANLAIAAADLRLQEADMAKTKIYAPIDGVVLTRDVDPGQTVASSLQAPVLFVIAAELENMQLEAAIDEADIGAVEKGQQARFTVDAFPQRRFDAEIRDIAYAAVTTEGVVTYEAKLSVSNEDLLLRPGMTATVSVVTRQAEDVVTVPSEAFRFRPPAAEERRGFSLQNLFVPRMGRGRRPPAERQATDGSRTLYVLRQGAAEPVRVRTGATDGTKTEVLSGVEPGDQIITGVRTARR